jgi:hypothetical protein
VTGPFGAAIGGVVVGGGANAAFGCVMGSPFPAGAEAGAGVPELVGGKYAIGVVAGRVVTGMIGCELLKNIAVAGGTSKTFAGMA